MATRKIILLKPWTWLHIILVVSCQHRPAATMLTGPAPHPAGKASSTGNETCWLGTVNGKTPVFLHYQPDSNLVIGQIIYLNTRSRTPITLLGTIEEDHSYRLLEFEKDGNISGILTGTPGDKAFDGSWFSPTTRKELRLQLLKKDSLVPSPANGTSFQDIFGHYQYQYSEAGYQGGLVIDRVAGGRAVFGISSVTSDPARNVAQIDEDTIPLRQTRFVYQLPGADDCGFEVKFYKGFAYVHYTRGTCEGQFGMNATIDGIFLKTN